MTANKNFLGLDQFVWWFGVVEDRQDPLGLGRVRVRIYGWHTDSLSEIPAVDLPWAHVMHSPNDRLFSTPRESDLVMGFFTDGVNAQSPVVVGVVPSYNTNKPDTGTGFHDLRSQAILKISPKKPASRKYNANGAGITIAEVNVGNTTVLESLRHPNVDEINKESISGVTRYQNLANTVIKARKDNLDKDVVTATGIQWSEPYPAYNALYPYNQANETESGHVFELDDTPGSERIAITHRSGSYVEWFPTGTKVEKVTKSNYQIVMGEDHLHVMGRVMITVDSDAYIRVVGNTNLQVENDLIANVSGSMNVSVGKALNFKANSVNFDIGTDTTISTNTLHLTACGEVDLMGSTVNMGSSGDTNLKSGGNQNIQGGSLNLNGGSTKIGGGSVDIKGTVKIDSLGSFSDTTGYSQVNAGAASPGSAVSATSGTATGLSVPPAVGKPTTGRPKAEIVPIPLNTTLVEFDATVGLEYKQQLFLDTAPDGTKVDPGSNTANVAAANANVSPCMFDTTSKTFLTDSSQWSIGDAGINLIESAEGFAKVVKPDTATAYPDPATGGEPLTIGYGSTSVAIDQPVTLGELMSRATAQDLLTYAINKKFLPALKQSVTVGLTQNMIDACLSLLYNIGPNRFASSTLVQKINAQDWCGAADQFLVWNKSAGKIMPGLTNRRKLERQLFLS